MNVGGAAGPGPGYAPAGASAAELVVVLALGGVVLSAVVGGVAATRRVATRIAASSARSDALRTVRGVVSGELRWGVPGRDHRIVEREVLALRAYRGRALPCGPGGEGELRVRYAGQRLPNPEKDSVLVLEAPGRWTSAALRERRRSGDESGCPDGRGAVEAWVLDPPTREPRLLRLYESGEYHLTGSAFRYRRGRGGRQPLTPEVLDDARSGWEAGPEGSVRIRLTTAPLLPGEPARRVRWTLRAADRVPDGAP